VPRRRRTRRHSRSRTDEHRPAGPIAPSVLNLGFPRVNRGVAILDNIVYVWTLDGYLVALDAKAGVERWITHVGENPTGHAITAAPLVVGDKVIVGISGGEAGIRGFLDAYDAKSGKPLWQFQTGGPIRSGPMSFLVGAKQHVAVAGGHAIFVFALD
jgi:outer membrane protein assembly factor BamB